MPAPAPRSSTASLTTPAGGPAAEPTHPCVRCGRPVSLDESLCEQCNPLGLSQPATSQAHGTVFLAIAGAVLALAVAGRLAIAGVGPFRGEVSAIQPTASGLAVTLTVHNDGTSSGATTCRVTETARNGTGPAAVIVSPAIEPGSSKTFSTPTTQFGTDALPLTVACQSP
jgi:predicted nucleic acid-binding Zn ribbon protein